MITTKQIQDLPLFLNGGLRSNILVDPDTPAETDLPEYVQPAEIDALERWVRNGGRLVLLGNEKGNAEFAHFNRLAKRFGIEFVETTSPQVAGKGILTVPAHTLSFGRELELYLVEIASRGRKHIQGCVENRVPSRTPMLL